jgi:exosortase N
MLSNVKIILKILLRNPRIQMVLWLMPVLLALPFIFPSSFLLGSNVIVGLCLFPFTLFVEGKQRINYFHLILTIVFGALALIYSVRMFYFLTLAFYALLVIELHWGKLNPIILFLLVLMSPVFHQVSVILGFPIRLLLSEWAGAILVFGGLDVVVEGNQMVREGMTFAVDEACMGLNMLAISLMMGVLILNYFYRTTKQKVSLPDLILFFSAIFIQNLVCNLLRIITLVTFKVAPENPLHEIIGILCLVSYVIIPAYFLARRIMTRFGTSFEEAPAVAPINLGRRISLSCLVIGVIFVGFEVSIKRTIASHHDSVVTVSTFPGSHSRRTDMPDGVTKIESDQCLLYIKHIPEFFSGEHTPLICWKGSGYNFKSVKEMRVEDKTIYVGKLKRNKDELCTAWWYSNGDQNTVDQWQWRLQMIQGQPDFYLINVTAKDERSMLHAVAQLLTKNTIRFRGISQLTNR